MTTPGHSNLRATAKRSQDSLRAFLNRNDPEGDAPDAYPDDQQGEHSVHTPDPDDAA